MEIFPSIEALLHYANTHLLLDELDYIYARNKILSLLSLDEFEEYEINLEEIEALSTPDDILNTIVAYAVTNKLIADEKDKKQQFADKIMDCVLKRPGEMADLFGGSSPSKAFEWLYDYGQKSGYIRQPNKKWDAKATKGRFDIAFSGLDCTSSCACTDKKAQKIKYPSCKLCRDNEGFKKELNKKSIPLELDGERMFFNFKTRPVLQMQGQIVSQQHSPFVIDKKALSKMFDFACFMPGWVIGAVGAEHESYITSSRLIPINKAPDIAKFKPKDYPYIAVTTAEWYVGTLRLVSTNKEKLIEYTDLILSRFKSLADGNTAAVSLYKKDTNFILELVLFNQNTPIAKEFSNLSTFKCACNYLGAFRFDQTTEDLMAQIARFLTKEERFSPAKLEGEMGKHADMIARLQASQGGSKYTALEASLEVKEEMGKTLEKALNSLNVPFVALDLINGTEN
ncbi:MAG: hypothetical protein FWD86_03670 [Firmicutes bacterium]|nr:hypothetical protein [Bacillota bacterium]